MEEITPVWEKSSGPRTFRQRQPRWQGIRSGILPQTTDSSSAVRVIERKSSPCAQAGIGASGASLAIE